MEMCCDLNDGMKILFYEVFFWLVIVAAVEYVIFRLPSNIYFRYSLRKSSVVVSVAGIALLCYQLGLLKRFMIFMVEAGGPWTLSQRILLAVPFWCWVVVVVSSIVLPLLNDRFWKWRWMNEAIFVVLTLIGSLSLLAIWIWFM